MYSTVTGQTRSIVHTLFMRSSTLSNNACRFPPSLRLLSLVTFPNVKSLDTSLVRALAESPNLVLMLRNKHVKSYSYGHVMLPFLSSNETRRAVMDAGMRYLVVEDLLVVAGHLDHQCKGVRWGGPVEVGPLQEDPTGGTPVQILTVNNSNSSASGEEDDWPWIRFGYESLYCRFTVFSGQDGNRLRVRVGEEYIVENSLRAFDGSSLSDPPLWPFELHGTSGYGVRSVVHQSSKSAVHVVSLEQCNGCTLTFESFKA